MDPLGFTGHPQTHPTKEPIIFEHAAISFTGLTKYERTVSYLVVSANLG